jgi:hypothetical protein
MADKPLFERFEKALAFTVIIIEGGQNADPSRSRWLLRVRGERPAARN